jgi:protein-tyrosine phosphatase
MIDLHSHILPGVDDGAGDLEASVAMAKAAVEADIETIVGTPHVNAVYDYDTAMIGRLAGELNIELARREVPLAVLPGAEIALERLPDLGDDELRRLCLGEGPYLLVESPYTRGETFLDEALFHLQVRGFRPVLAHPERCPIFQADRTHLLGLVERGILCSVNAGSMAGRFGSTVERFVLRMFSEGLVHNVASDSHDSDRRPPALSFGFEHAEAHLPGVLGQSRWFTESAPAAILSGEPLPSKPEAPRTRHSRWRRLLRRR